MVLHWQQLVCIYVDKYQFLHLLQVKILKLGRWEASLLKVYMQFIRFDGYVWINLDSKAWVKSIKNWQDFSIVCGGHLTFSKISASTEDVAICVRLLKNEESHAEGAFSVKIKAISNFTRSLCWVKTLKGAGLRMVQHLATGPPSPEWPHSQSFSRL